VLRSRARRHWLHRWLTDQGVTSYIVDPSSIEVSRRGRRAKTDRIDLEKLMRAFLAYLRGEPRVCSMLHVPSPEDEDRKRSSRGARSAVEGADRAHQSHQGAAVWPRHS